MQLLDHMARREGRISSKLGADSDIAVTKVVNLLGDHDCVQRLIPKGLGNLDTVPALRTRPTMENAQLDCNREIERPQIQGGGKQLERDVVSPNQGG